MKKMERVLLGTVLGMWVFATAAEASSLADAAEQKKWSEVRALAGNPATKGEINNPQADGSTALLWAAHHDDADMVSLLLEQGAQPDLANRYGLTPLSAAALNGNADIVGRLLAAGASPDKAAEGGDTPLMIAARAGSTAAVKSLLDKGASVDVRDAWHGETALMWAAGENHADVVRLLVAAGADVNAASTTFDWKDIKHGGVQSQLPKGGLTALMHAARQNAYDAVVALLELGADPNIKEPQGVSTLRIAAANGHFDVALALLEHGADPNEGALVEAVKVRTTPIMRAATNRSDRTTPLEFIQALFAHGAKADSLAPVAMPKKDAFEISSAAGVSPSETALFLAATANDRELMELMVGKGANVNHANKDGITVLMTSLGIKIKRATGTTPPPGPSEEKRLAAAAWLLDLGSEVNAVDKRGLSALHSVAEMGNDSLVRLLVDRGARLDLKDESNRTALDMAKGVPPLQAPGAAPIDPRLLSEPKESTIALLRNLMAGAGVREEQYRVPGSREDLPVSPVATVAPGDGSTRKAVTAVLPRS